MKKIVSAVLVMMLALSMLAGCSKDEPAATTAAQTTEAQTTAAQTEAATTEAETTTEAPAHDLLATIKDKGTITIAMEGNWAPWTYEDEDGNLVGFEVEVSTAVAEKLGVTPEYITGEWDGLLAGVQGGRYDLMANGVGYSEERAQAYRYSDFYAFNRTALVVRGDNEEIKSMEDLKGKTTCNSANSTYQLAAEEYGATVLDVEALDGTIEMVLSGRVDATLNAEVSINDYMKEKPDANIKIVGFYDEIEQVGMIMPAGDDSASLQEAVNAALAELAAEGKLSEISIKYFGIDITTND